MKRQLVALGLIASLSLCAYWASDVAVAGSSAKLFVHAVGPDIADSLANVKDKAKANPVSTGGVFDAGTGMTTPYYFVGANQHVKRTKEGVGPRDIHFSFALAQMDYASQTYPLTIGSPSVQYNIQDFTTSTPQVAGAWGRTGGSASITIESYKAKSRLIQGTYTMTLMDAATFLVLQPITVTGSFALKLPKIPK